jgi:hypothetical protein
MIQIYVNIIKQIIYISYNILIFPLFTLIKIKSLKYFY